MFKQLFFFAAFSVLQINVFFFFFIFRFLNRVEHHRLLCCFAGCICMYEVKSVHITIKILHIAIAIVKSHKLQIIVEVKTIFHK